MIKHKVKFLIIGAGLSGLSAAHKLIQAGESDFIIVDSRNRTGGRIKTEKGIDFGATWFQEHHVNMMGLLADLKIETFHQIKKGKSILVYSTMAPEHYFDGDYGAPSYRIKGGSAALINELSARVKDQLMLDITIDKISEHKDHLTACSDSLEIECSKVIVCIPPRIATRIQFSPSLPNELLSAMESTHTWMSNAIKVGISFSSPFWRKKGLSGMIIGQVGPVVELYDHTDYKNEVFSLMGFVNEGLRDETASVRKQKIIDYLSKYLGEEIENYLHYEEKDWARDKHTSCEKIKSIYMSPSYGNPLFAQSFFNERLLFASAETSPIHGGYMDGAVFSGFSAAKRILE